MHTIISSKSKFLEIAAEGSMFNQMPSWHSIPEVLASDHYERDPINSEVMIRYKDAGSPFMTPNVRIGLYGMNLKYTAKKLIERGAVESKLYYTWMSPVVGRRINAELVELPRGLYLNYSTAQFDVRRALETAGRHAERSAAWRILEHTLDCNGLENVRHLLDKFPGHAIELTAFDRVIGSFARTECRTNTVIWEVRMY